MACDRFPSDMQLASEPGIWKVVLTSGDGLELLTHGYSIEGEEYVFVLLM
jgi:hypothetical protein